MKHYLIDTHILLWWLSNDRKLDKKTAALIQDPDNTIFVSVVSVWEINIKKSLNKLVAPDNLKEELFENSLEILPITLDHVLYVEHLPLIHNDPFDRLLIAQCKVEGFTFVTEDHHISQYNLDLF